MDPQESNPRLDDFHVSERASAAQNVLDTPVFAEAINSVYSRVLGTLINAEVGSLTASAAHATLKAVHGVKRQLEQFVLDDKMRKRFPSKGSS